MQLDTRQRKGEVFDRFKFHNLQAWKSHETSHKISRGLTQDALEDDLHPYKFFTTGYQKMMGRLEDVSPAYGLILGIYPLNFKGGNLWHVAW